MKKTSILTCEKNAITRAYTLLAAEIGHIAASIAIYEQIVAHHGADSARWFLQRNGRDFPILSTLADEDGTQRISKRIRDLNDQLATLLRHKTDIVCIGTEAAWLDSAAIMYSDKTFHVVPHSSNADMDRFLSNYGKNVCVHDSVDLTRLCGTASVIVTSAFGVTEHTFHTYPVVYRICGRDTRQAFSELIALDIMDRPLRFYPADLVEIGTDEMTQIFPRALESARRS